MGERKGTNKYYPPDYDPKKGGLNKFMGTHALRERARKLHLGILIIRFELPYNIWCDGCGNHIGMGVRYNAEKTKVGMYYSTPVYQFRMKCHLCDSHFEMKTDPGNLDYVIVSGARRQENRWNPEENGQVVPDDKRVIRQLADDPMFKLQHGVEDKTKLSSVAPTLGALEDLQERWKDDYSANKALRDMFRTKKKEIKAAEEQDKEFLAKRSLDIPLLKESEEDAKIASLIRLQPSQSSEERQKQKRKEIDSKSNFPVAVPQDTKDGIIPTSPSLSKQIKNNNFSHLNINSQTLAKQRSSLGISLSKKPRCTSLSLLDSKVVVKEEPIIGMEVEDDFGFPVTKHSLEPGISCTQSIGNDVPQRSINNLSPEERSISESGGMCSRSHSDENTETVTTESQPKVIISSALEVQSSSEGEERGNEEGEKDEHKIRDSSTRSSAPERELPLPTDPSTSSSKVPCGLSLISCDYGSSSSGNEDD